MFLFRERSDSNDLKPSLQIILARISEVRAKIRRSVVLYRNGGIVLHNIEKTAVPQ